MTGMWRCRVNRSGPAFRGGWGVVGGALPTKFIALDAFWRLAVSGSQWPREKFPSLSTHHFQHNGGTRLSLRLPVLLPNVVLVLFYRASSTVFSLWWRLLNKTLHSLNGYWVAKMPQMCAGKWWIYLQFLHENIATTEMYTYAFINKFGFIYGRE